LAAACLREHPLGAAIGESVLSFPVSKTRPTNQPVLPPVAGRIAAIIKHQHGRRAAISAIHVFCRRAKQARAFGLDHPSLARSCAAASIIPPPIESENVDRTTCAGDHEPGC